MTSTSRGGEAPFDLRAVPPGAARLIRSIRRRVNAAVALRASARALAALLMAAGACIVAQKALALAAPWCAWPAAVGGTTLVAAWVLLRALYPGGRRFDDRDAAVVYDVAIGGDGLALTAAEVPGEGTGAWRGAIEERAAALGQRRMPVAFRWRDILGPLGVPALFLAGALVVPARVPEEARAQIPLRRAAEDAATTAETLAEADLLEPEELAAVRDELARIASDEEREATRAWEAVDAVEEKLGARIQTAADALAWSLQAAEALADAPLDAAKRAELEAALSRLAKTGALGELASQFAGAAGGDASLPDDPAELARALRTLDGALTERAQKLAKSAGSCRSQSARDALRDLSEYCDARIAEGPGLGDLQLAEGPGVEGPGTGPDGDGRPGSGGVNRGRGDAPMLWGTPAGDEGAKFTPFELPPGEVDPQTSEIVAVRFAAPESSGERGGGTSGAAATSGVGEAAGGARLSPARREIVRQYFSNAGGGR